MAATAYLSITGQKQGHIQGSVTLKGKEGQIAVYAVNHEILSPRDPASGLPTGRRMHKPLIITKELDKSTPLLYNSLTTNENLPEVILRFWAPSMHAGSGSGMEIQNFTIKLTNASISSIELDMENNKLTELIKLPVLQRISFTYQKIEWTWVDGGITATDDWEANV